MREHVLLTGGGGLLGKVVLETLLRTREDVTVDVLLRGDAEARLQRILGSPCLAAVADEARRRVRPVSGDLSTAGAGVGDAALRDVTRLIHCAASVDFDLPPQEAAVANGVTSLEALGLALRAPRLRAMVAVSTAYVSPLAGTPVHEQLVELGHDPQRLFASMLRGEVLADLGYPNTYTLSKCIAEHLLARGRQGIPLTIVRPSIISACQRHPFEGWIDSAAALAGFVVLYGTGRLRTLRGDPETRLDVVPCDEVAARVVRSVFAPPPSGFAIRHAVAGLAASIRIADCAEAVREVFGARPLAYADGEGSAHQRAFASFMRNTWDFRSSLPLDDDFCPRRYAHTIAAGVKRHLVDERRRVGRNSGAPT